MSRVLDAAREYARLGYKVFPLDPGLKRPHRRMAPRGLYDATGDVATIEQWFTRDPTANVGLVCENLIVIDVDPGNDWSVERLKQEVCPVQTTPRGGMHLVFRRPDGHKEWHNSTGKVAAHIDTRTNGGYIVAAPSHTIDCPKEKTVDGDYAIVSQFVPFDELPDPPGWLVKELDVVFAPKVVPISNNPIDLSSSDVLPRASAYLAAMPGAVSGQRGHNATYTAATVLVHGFGLSEDDALSLLMNEYNPRCEPPWSEKELRHKVEDAATKPHDYTKGWLLEDSPHITSGVDITGIEAMSVASAEPGDDELDRIVDPGPTPVELMRVPGFVGEVMDYCLETAPYPNPVLAFCGALVAQAYLGGRKVRDPGDNRTNVYMLGLAHSAAGKDWPRKINMRIAHEIGRAQCIGDRIASGEGLQDALLINPCMLFQTDEINGMLLSINQAKDARHENLMSQLLTLHSNANSLFAMRSKAGKEPGVIDQPCLSIFGTAIPNHFYESLSERMLTNGLCARMVVFESGKRGKGQEPRIRKLPPRVVETAHWWDKFQPGEGNLSSWHPIPVIVEHTEAAKKLLIASREDAESEYDRAEDRSDPVATTVWGRATEHVRKLALLYAISENHESPEIGVDAVAWASRLITHQTHRMLAMAAGHVAQNPFHADCLRLIQKLRAAPRNELGRSTLLKRMKVKARDFNEIIATLKESGVIVSDTAKTAGRDACVYRLLGGERWRESHAKAV